MKKLILILIIIFLTEGGVIGEYLVTHTKQNDPWENYSIDPGINPGWSGYQTIMKWFDNINKAIEYINTGQYGDAKLYYTEFIQLDKNEVLEKEEIVKHYKTVYKLKEKQNEK